jgi:hypothetical protein
MENRGSNVQTQDERPLSRTLSFPYLNAMNRVFLFMAFFVCVTGEVRSQWIVSETRLRTRNPIGWTDGVVQRINVGTDLSWGVFHLRLTPEVVTFRSDRRGDVLAVLLSEATEPENPRVRTYLQQETNRIDAPVRYDGFERISVFPGQSRLALRAVGLELGVSTESLFWGPGVRNSLILSGSTFGFAHGVFKTTRPLRVPFGSIEGSIISGRLENSNQVVQLPEDQDAAYRPYLNTWRYISGFDASFAPSMLPGLEVGVSRTFVGYSTVLDEWKDYFPMFQPLTKDNFQDEQNPTGDDEWDQQLSAYFSWLFEESGFRVFGELGRNDHSADVRDLIIEPEHSRAYVVGVEKKTETWHTVVEITQLAMTKTQELRASPIWYTHHLVRHGITHRGELLGPKIGPGSNSWYTSISRTSKTGTVFGLSLERVHRQEDLYRRLFPGDASRRWSDLTVGLNSKLTFGPVDLVSVLSVTKSNNYAFQSEWNPWDVGMNLTMSYDFGYLHK